MVQTSVGSWLDVKVMAQEQIKPREQGEMYKVQDNLTKLNCFWII